MFFSKVFVALAAIVVIAASPMKRAASRSYTLTSTTAVSGDLPAEFNYSEYIPARQVDDQLSGSSNVVDEFPFGTLYNPGVTYTDNGDGTYSVGSALVAEGLTDEEIAEIINWLAGETLQGRTAG
ncbi:hypothetical protein Hypma_014294 [Hypsizygus marmoreus]|uniref:Uncharacterized protein n=1 Tax=Hypsizygus marmoreus TaxID=39966 RepID=A0A369JAY9_HYPMA|nr:hypothetical protein Hypma_014294 [Hypsizygus marmoreus]